MKKIRDFNFGYLVDSSLIISVAISLIAIYSNLSSKEKLLIIAGAISLIVIAIVIFALCQETKVINESEDNVFYKPETSKEPIAYNLPKGETNNIDGVKSKGIVYKIPNFTHVRIKKNGDVEILSFFCLLIYWIRGGIRRTAPDSDWNPLFTIK